MKIDWKKEWKKVPGIIRHDFVRKLIAAILAFLLCQFVSCSKDNQEVYEIVVELKAPETYIKQDESKTIELTRSDIKNIRLNLNVRKSLWAVFRSKNTPVCSLKEEKAFQKQYEKGKLYKVIPSKDNIIPPFGIEIISVPSPEPIIYDVSAVKNVKVKIVLKEDELDRNYIVEKVKASPDTVSVSGSESIIRNMEFVSTRPVPLRDIKQSFDYTAEIDSPNPQLTISPEKVFLHVDIRKNIKTKEFKLRKILVMNDSSSLMHEIIGGTVYAMIQVKGNNAQIDALKPEQIRPYIDISHLNSPGIYSVEVGCWIEDNSVKVIKIEPSKVKVKISKK